MPKRKHFLIPILFVVIFTSCAFLSLAAAEELPDKPVDAGNEAYWFKLTEILANPDSVDTNNEWVEVLVEISDSRGEQTADNDLDKASNEELRGILEVSNLVLKVNGKAVSWAAGQELKVGYNQLMLAGSPLPNCSSKPCEVKLEVYWIDSLQDSMSYSETNSGKSYSLDIDGEWSWEYLLSPGAENMLPQPAPEHLIISEIYPAPAAGESEWIEILNTGNGSVQLAGWIVTDGSGKLKLTGEVAGAGYLLIDKLNFALNNDGDTLQLISPTGRIVHQVTYTEVEKQQAVVINLDGSQAITTQATPGTANILVIPIDVSAEQSVSTTKSKKVSKSASSSKSNILGAQGERAQGSAPALPVHNYRVPKSRTDLENAAFKNITSPKLAWKLDLKYFYITTLLINLILLYKLYLPQLITAWQRWEQSRELLIIDNSKSLES